MEHGRGRPVSGQAKDKRKRGIAWLVTMNNPDVHWKTDPDSCVAKLQRTLKTLTEDGPLEYACFVAERGEETHTLHFHVFGMYDAVQRNLQARVKKDTELVGDVKYWTHGASTDEMRKYACNADKPTVIGGPWEFGTYQALTDGRVDNKVGKSADGDFWKEAKDLTITEPTLCDRHPGMYGRYHKGVAAVRMRMVQKEAPSLEWPLRLVNNEEVHKSIMKVPKRHFWIKCPEAHVEKWLQAHPGVYIVPESKWMWDAYNYESVIVFTDSWTQEALLRRIGRVLPYSYWLDCRYHPIAMPPGHSVLIVCFNCRVGEGEQVPENFYCLEYVAGRYNVTGVHLS